MKRKKYGLWLERWTDCTLTHVLVESKSRGRFMICASMLHVAIKAVGINIIGGFQFFHVCVEAPKMFYGNRSDPAIRPIIEAQLMWAQLQL